jgi:hypothetical protein
MPNIKYVLRKMGEKARCSPVIPATLKVEAGGSQIQYQLE